MNVKKDTMITELNGYTIKTFEEQAYFEHYFNLGPYGKALLSPIEHIGILTWHQLLLHGFGDYPLIIPNDDSQQIRFFEIRCDMPNDFDLLKKLAGGFMLYENTKELNAGFHLVCRSNGSPMEYHDTIPTVKLGRFYDEHAWILAPVYTPKGAIDPNGKQQVLHPKYNLDSPNVFLR